MQSSWEILALLLKAMGAVLGIAVVALAVFVLARDTRARSNLAAACEVAAAAARVGFEILAEYAKAIGTVCFNYLQNTGRKIARTFLT